MVHTPYRKSRIPLSLIPPLTLLILIGCIMVAGCINAGNKNTTATNSSTPAITTSASAIPTTIPVVATTIVPNLTVTSNVTQKGQLTVSIGDYSAEPPATVFVDNVAVGEVTAGYDLNLTTTLGRHAVKLCVIGACFKEDVIILPSEPTELDFREQLKNVTTGPLTVSIGRYVAELPVFVDNIMVGNVSNMKPLNMKATEGNHTVKVCIGILCENETVEIKFAQPVYLEFGERLKKVMDVFEPTIQIIDTQKSGSRVVVSVEFINPTKKDLTMAATIQVAYSYVAPSTHWREGNAVQGSLSRSVKAGNRTVQNLSLTLTGGSAYISEIPSILDSSFA
jgi:hypothetical protein